MAGWELVDNGTGKLVLKQKPDAPIAPEKDKDKEWKLSIEKKLEDLDKKLSGFIEAQMGGLGNVLTALGPKIETLSNTLDEKTPEGEQAERNLTVTDEKTDLKDLNWYSMLVMVDGPGNVYMGVNDRNFPSTPMHPTDKIWIDMGKRGGIKRVRLFCDEGETSNVRILAIK